MVAAWLATFRPLLRWLTPLRRRLLLSLAALFVAVRWPLRSIIRSAPSVGVTVSPAAAGLLIAVLFAFVFGCYLVAQRFSSLPLWVRRRPQICLHAIFWSVVAVVWASRPRGDVVGVVLIGCVCALPLLLWRVGYMLYTAQRGKMRGTRFTDHLLYIYPIWGGSDTPYGKGFDYLRANEAQDETTLAQSQLAGIKCFLLAGVWVVGKTAMAGVVFAEANALTPLFGGRSLGVPRLGAMFAAPDAYPIALCWVALYCELVWAVLALAATGHVIVGWLRVFGFYVFRNTYKPLLAESVVEFWNRYYYYFKELLVNFFFYPTFTRRFKNSPRLRLFTAVFAAAFVGNMYYHWLGLDVPLAAGDFGGMWAALQSRLFYCFLLALGIYVSMRREQTRPKTLRTPARRILAIFGVWTFFGIIHIWAQKDPAPFLARMQFFVGLFGVR